MPQQTSELTAAVRARARERQAELCHRSEDGEVGYTGSGTGWSVQSGGLITNDDKA
jgi:hypothetical protein